MIFEFLFYIGHVGKQLDKKATLIIISKFNDVINWETYLQYTYCPISQRIKDNLGMKFVQKK